MRIRASFAAERAAAVSTMAGHGHKDEEGQLCRNISLVSVRGAVWVVGRCFWGVLAGCDCLCCAGGLR